MSAAAASISVLIHLLLTASNSTNAFTSTTVSQRSYYRPPQSSTTAKYRAGGAVIVKDEEEDSGTSPSPSQPLQKLPTFLSTGSNSTEEGERQKEWPIGKKVGNTADDGSEEIAVLETDEDGKVEDTEVSTKVVKPAKAALVKDRGGWNMNMVDYDVAGWSSDGPATNIWKKVEKGEEGVEGKGGEAQQVESSKDESKDEGVDLVDEIEGGVNLALASDEDEEEDMDDIASMLMETPPALKKKGGKDGSDEKGSASEDADGEEGGGIVSLAEKRAMMKAARGALPEQMKGLLVEDEPETKDDADNEFVEAESKPPTSPASIKEGSAAYDSVMSGEYTVPTWNSKQYWEVYENAEIISNEDDLKGAVENSIDVRNNYSRGEDKVVEMAERASSDDIDVDGGEVKPALSPAASKTPGEKSMNQHEGIDISASTTVNEEKEKGSVDNEQATETSFLPPTPPLTPPPGYNVMNQTLTDQREELDGMRMKIDELEGELRIAREAAAEVADNDDNDLEAMTASLREEYDHKLDLANDTIAELEKKATALNRELIDGKTTLEEVLEEKERVAAEYSYVVKSYADLKGSSSDDWSTKLDESREEITRLELQLANATSMMERYKSDSNNWREETANKSNQLDLFTSRVANMQSTIDDLQAGIKSTQTNLDLIISTAKDEERARSKINLQRLADEYELLLDRKSKKIGVLRTAIRSANNKKRRIERNAAREKVAAVQEVRDELTVEMDMLKDTLNEREEEIKRMESVVDVAVGKIEERERLGAELMFLTQKFENLRKELVANAENYQDCIESFEKEATEKDKRIIDLEKELKLANEKIGQLESRIEHLTSELEKERSINANLTATVSALQSELDGARKNAKGYDDVIAILRKEAKVYETQLFVASDETEALKQQKIDLEELISKTKDSLVDEKKRVANALEEKDTRIAQLDRDLADKMNEVHTNKAALDETTSRLKKMTGKYNSEKGRADALDEKIQKLNQLSSQSSPSVEEEVDMRALKLLLDDVTASNDKFKSLVATYEDKMKVMSQELLLSGQNMSKKQAKIASLQEELSQAKTNVQTTTEKRTSTTDEISTLKARLEDVQSKSTVWKAQANGMIVTLTNDLREKEGSLAKLQNKLDKELSSRDEQKPSSSGGNVALEKQIAELKSAMEDAQNKAKEKLRHKNQSLKEMEDTVATLTANMEDLKREKDQLTKRLDGEIGSGNEVLLFHERQLRQTEERLAKEHLAAMTKMEREMKQTIAQLEVEVKWLKKNQPTTDEASATASPKATQEDEEKLQRMERALQKSKEKEVSLISENMKMQHQIQNLQVRAQEERKPSFSLDDDDDESSEDDVNDSVKLPRYYKEKQRPRVIRFVGNTWRKLFRRKKL